MLILDGHVDAYQEHFGRNDRRVCMYGHRLLTSGDPFRAHNERIVAPGDCLRPHAASFYGFTPQSTSEYWVNLCRERLLSGRRGDSVSVRGELCLPLVANDAGAVELQSDSIPRNPSGARPSM